MSSTSSLPTVGSTNSAANPALPTLPTQTLNQQDFLQLLVTQLTEQEPLNPQTNTDFAAQMAQFSSLQATQSMSTAMASFQADSLLGSTVDVAGANGTVRGVVSLVQMNAWTPQLVLDNG